MSNSKIPGRSNLRSAKGVLKVHKGYLRVPYCLLQSNAFLELTPLAVKIYFIMLRQWKTHSPDEPVEITISRICELCPSEDTPTGHVGRRKITKAIQQLITSGFIEKVHSYKSCNKYYMEQRRFTGEWRA